jgi:hypothetical protein
MIKYIICPGYVTSKTDGDRHYITSRQLIELYGVNPKECAIEKEYIRSAENAIFLRPRYSGHYREWLAGMANQAGTQKGLDLDG